MDTFSTDSQAWVREPTPAQRRLAAIRAAAEQVSPHALPECMPAMLRDLQTGYDWLVEVARVQRAETLCEISELLTVVGQPAAAGLLNAQILIEHTNTSLPAPLRDRILAGLAANPAAGPPPEHPQAVTARMPREAWVNRLRAETLRLNDRAMTRVAHVGLAIAHYADHQGGGAYPSRACLATLAGCSEEQANRAVRVLCAVGLLATQRASHRPPHYQLLLPAESLDWAAHLPLYAVTARRTG